jgi:hypothetical protein
MKNFIVIALLCLFCTPVIVLCQDPNLPPEWVFDDKDEIKTWGAVNQLQPLVVETVKNKNGDKVTIVKTVSIGTDPHVYLGVIEPFDGKKYPTIYIGVRANVASTWQIYYATKEDPGYSEAQRQNFQVDASDDFLDLQFKMTEGGWQSKTITGFRFDPGTIAGVEAEIDYLSLRGVASGKPKAVEYKSKLAITWASIKR